MLFSITNAILYPGVRFVIGYSYLSDTLKAYMNFLNGFDVEIIVSIYTLEISELISRYQTHP